MEKQLSKTINYLKKKKKVLIVVTSNRWVKEKEKPKTTRIGEFIDGKLGKRSKIIDASKLTIFPCEGNVSIGKGNSCGVLGAKLKDKRKNPTGDHRCWASINNPTDELWKITKELFISDAVLFLGPVRWGAMNSIYQKLIERLTFIENRHTTFEGENILKGKDAGIIAIGQNWNVSNVLKTEKKVLKFYGFDTPKEMSWYWQYTKDENDESQESYQRSEKIFEKKFLE